MDMAKFVKHLPEMDNNIIDTISNTSNTQIVINWNESAKVLSKAEMEILNIIVGKLQDSNN